MLNNNAHSMPKNKKLHHEEAAGSRRSLNDFNDAILKHILSFLPTIVAARTSVLSKRWEYMWTSLPALDFDEFNLFNNFQNGSPKLSVPEREHFMNFVERALILHKSCIRKFSLCCDVEDDFSRIKRWISGVSCNVKEFEIKLSWGNDQLVFPFCLFNCATMEVLKLHGNYSDIQLPSQISLPCLKILTLRSLLIKDSHSINILFAGPALEQLFIHYCKWIGEYDIIISAPKLWKLSIYEKNEIVDGLATISAPQLQTLEYKGSFFKEYRFPHPPSITNATLEICDWMVTIEINKVHFDKVLRSLQSVKCLELSPAFASALSHSTVPKFRKLINLEVFGFSYNTALTIKDLERLVNKCPCLESLKLVQLSTYKFSDVSNLKFQYLPSTLKEFMIGDFSGGIVGIYFIRILLSKLTSLETMKIVFRGYPKAAKREGIKSILSALHRGSKSCKLIIG